MRAEPGRFWGHFYHSGGARPRGMVAAGALPARDFPRALEPFKFRSRSRPFAETSLAVGDRSAYSFRSRSNSDCDRGNISANDLGSPSSKTTLAWCLIPKFVKAVRIGMTSRPLDASS